MREQSLAGKWWCFKLCNLILITSALLHVMMDAGNNTKLLRAPNLKRGRPDERVSERLKLEKVFGVTLSSRAALAYDPFIGAIAYPAGCTVVLYNPRTRHQTHIINACRKSVTTLAFSTCGKYLITGETGHQPAVRVWELEQPATGRPHHGRATQVAEFFGHKFGVGCVAFSPSNKIVVSVGSQHDMIVNVWDWRTNTKLASNKVSTKIKAIAFSENGNYFVTVGNRLVKFWYLDCGRNKYNKEAVPLMGRSAILGEQRNNNFVDVACGRGECGDNTYAITRSGLLCEFNNRRLLDKWVQLHTTSANSISLGEKFIFVGCDAGIVRCFDPHTLQFITTLPRPHYLGVDVALGTAIEHMATPPPNAKYPDAIAVVYDEQRRCVSCVYNDHSIYMWDVGNIFHVGKTDSALYHSGCIWGVETAPNGCPLPKGSFVTCSADDTIRVWTLDRFNEEAFKGMYKKNIYSKELLKVIYVDPEFNYIKDKGGNVADSNKENANYDSVNGVRSIRLSPDGGLLASGDRTGNIRIHETQHMTEKLMIEAHDAEVLCLEFSNTGSGSEMLMASASRDRLIHVFDVNREFDFLQTLDDHSSSITSVRFLNSATAGLRMISCGADKSLIFRTLSNTPNGGPQQFQRSHNATGKNTLYDMEVDAGEKHVLTACQDRNVRVYNVANGRHTKSFKGCAGDEGSLIKIVMDKSGTYLASSSTDKTLSVYDYYTGECMATMCGHSELATSLRFTSDCKRIISTSGDGCIFVWKLPRDMVVSMHARYNQQVMLSGGKLPADEELFSENESDGDDDVLNHTFFKQLDMGKLPTWAKKKMVRGFKPSEQPPEKEVAAPKGRWAERAATDIGKDFYSYPSDIDSSLESDHDPRKSQGLKPPVGSGGVGVLITIDQNLEETAAHDADVDSDHDYHRQQPLYYPISNDTASGSEYTVNNIDTDELRKSVRRAKRASLPPLTQALSTGTGSQESDDDDDEASTPSGENTDANPMSMLSTSMESLCAAREKFLQSTYESLSGTEESPSANKTSISAQYHTTRSLLGLRNVSVVNAAKQTKNDVETSKKREHLNKMIADTKKKLQSIGYVSPLKASQSICDLSHVPEKEQRQRGAQGNDPATNHHHHNHLVAEECTNPFVDHQLNKNASIYQAAGSQSVPSDLQLCGCYMREIRRNLNGGGASARGFTLPVSTKLSDILSKSPEKHEQSLAAWIEPRKMQLDKTLNKNKMYKSLPVSPVSEDFEDEGGEGEKKAKKDQNRKSFSYFLDLEKKTEEDSGASGASNAFSFKQICDDIEKFSRDFSRNYQAIEDIFNSSSSGGVFVNSGAGFQKAMNASKTAEWLSAQFGPSRAPEIPAMATTTAEEDIGNFSSDSLEDCSFNSMRPCKKKHLKGLQPPRRCVSNNELYNLTQDVDPEPEMPRSHSQSQSFYLNPSAYNSQESILSSEENLLDRRTRSFCNSMESILSNESDCKSAPLECLFRDCDTMRRSKSCYNEMVVIQPSKYAKTVQTQTDFQTPEQLVVKKSKSTEFQQRILRFEQKQQAPAASDLKALSDLKKSKLSKDLLKAQQVKHKMDIPSLQSKNAQYKSKFCNVLNNKPEHNAARQLLGNPQFALTTQNLPTSNNININLSLKNKNKLQETASLDRHLLSKGLLDPTEKICHKPPKAVRRHSSKTRRKSSMATRTTYEYVKKEDLNKINLENSPPGHTASIEFSYKETNAEKELDDAQTEISEIGSQSPSMENKLGELGKSSAAIAMSKSFEQVQSAIENIKTLNEIQRKMAALCNLIELYKTSLTIGKVRALSSMYENLSKCQPPKRNLSLPDFGLEKYQHDVRNLHVEEPELEGGKYAHKDTNGGGSGGRTRKTWRRFSQEDDAELRSVWCAGSDTNDGCASYEPDEEEDEVQRSGSSAMAVQSRMAAAAAMMADSSDGDTPTGSMRRACSLSDLSHQRITGNNSQPSHDSKYNLRNAQVSRLAGGGASNAMMMRASSTSVLNPSDSDDGSVGGRNGNAALSEKQLAQSRLMRPTISSQNKVANAKNTLRKRYAHSALNLSTITHEDSSSEESEAPIAQSTKPVVPPRTRLPPGSGDIKHFNNLREKLKPVDRGATTNGNAPPAPSSRAVNRLSRPPDDATGEPATNQESKRFCTTITSNLLATAEKLTKLVDAPHGNDAHYKSVVADTLESVVRTQRLLLELLQKEGMNGDAIVMPPPPSASGDLVGVMQHYCDALRRTPN